VRFVQALQNGVSLFSVRGLGHLLATRVVALHQRQCVLLLLSRRSGGRCLRLCSGSGSGGGGGFLRGIMIGGGGTMSALAVRRQVFRVVGDGVGSVARMWGGVRQGCLGVYKIRVKFGCCHPSIPLSLS